MFEKPCAFEANSFLRIDSSELATAEPFGRVNEHPDLIEDREHSEETLPTSAVVAGGLPAHATAEPAEVSHESDDLALVARSRGGIRRRRYELRFSYYLSFGVRFGFLLRFLHGLLGNAGRDLDRGTPSQPDIPLEPDKSGTVWKRS